MDTEEKKITESGTDNLLDTVLLGMSSKDSKKEISELGKVVKDRLENLINLDNLLCNGVEDICCVVIHISKLFKEKGEEELGKKFVQMQKNFIDTIIEQLKTLKLICEEKYFDEEKYIGEYLSQLNVICRQLGLYKKLIPIVDDKADTAVNNYSNLILIKPFTDDTDDTEQLSSFNENFFKEILKKYIK
jgi:hypothetical protein